MKLTLPALSLSFFLSTIVLAVPTSNAALEARAAEEDIGCPYVWCITKTKRAPVPEADAKEDVGWCPYGPCITKSKAKREAAPAPEAEPEAEPEAKAKAKEDVGWCPIPALCITKK